MKPNAYVETFAFWKDNSVPAGNFHVFIQVYLLEEEGWGDAVSSKLDEYFCKRKATPPYVFLSEFELK
jgi:hypothetical protein